jgi:hypothetical protein
MSNDSETSGGSKKTESGGDTLSLEVFGRIAEDIHAGEYHQDQQYRLEKNTSDLRVIPRFCGYFWGSC